MLYGSSTISHARYGVAFAPGSKSADFDAIAALERMLYRPAPPRPRRPVGEALLPQHCPAPPSHGRPRGSAPPRHRLAPQRAMAKGGDDRGLVMEMHDEAAPTDTEPQYPECHRPPPTLPARNARAPWDTSMVSPRLQWIMTQRAEHLRRSQKVHNIEDRIGNKLHENVCSDTADVAEDEQEKSVGVTDDMNTHSSTRQSMRATPRLGTQKIVGGRHHASVQVLVEISYKGGDEGGQMLSIQHNHGKYESYFKQVAAALTGMIPSPFDPNHSIAVTVHATESANAAPAVWDLSGHGSIPANVPFICAGNSNGTRLGAFEVYLCAPFPEVEGVPCCSGLHSKLRSRHWPNVKQLKKKCYEILLPVFNRWKHDEDLHAAIPSLSDASGTLGPRTSTLRRQKTCTRFHLAP